MCPYIFLIRWSLTSCRTEFCHCSPGAGGWPTIVGSTVHTQREDIHDCSNCKYSSNCVSSMKVIVQMYPFHTHSRACIIEVEGVGPVKLPVTGPLTPPIPAPPPPCAMVVGFMTPFTGMQMEQSCLPQLFQCWMICREEAQCGSAEGQWNRRLDSNLH